jgi:hypothetical protein
MIAFIESTFAPGMFLRVHTTAVSGRPVRAATTIRRVAVAMPDAYSTSLRSDAQNMRRQVAEWRVVVEKGFQNATVEGREVHRTPVLPINGTEANSLPAPCTPGACHARHLGPPFNPIYITRSP